MDMFDMSLGFSSLSESLSRIKCPTLVSIFYIICYFSKSTVGVRGKI